MLDLFGKLRLTVLGDPKHHVRRRPWFIAILQLPYLRLVNPRDELAPVAHPVEIAAPAPANGAGEAEEEDDGGDTDTEERAQERERGRVPREEMLAQPITELGGLGGLPIVNATEVLTLRRSERCRVSLMFGDVGKWSRLPYISKSWPLTTDPETLRGFFTEVGRLSSNSGDSLLTRVCE